MKKNSNSCADESVNAPTTKPASEESNMSAGAEMLIERMKTNPEDFKYGGRFYRVVQALEDGQQWVSRRDRDALRVAYDATIKEAEFSEWVYGEIFNPKEPEPDLQSKYANALGQSMMNTKNALAGQMLTPGAIYGSPLQGAALTVNANAGNPTMTLGNTTIDESTLKKIKNKLGL